MIRSGMLKHGIEHLVDQIVNPKINSLFLPKIESVVKEFLGIQDTPEPIVDEVKNTQQENSEVKQESEIVKVEEKKEKEVYEELKETVKQEIVEPQPMDIATDSEGSNDAMKITFNQETANENDSDDKESWPTPPKPEMFTPERSDDSKDDQKLEINQNEEYKKDSEQNDESNEKSTLNIDLRKENIIVKVEDSEKTINVPSSSKTNIEDVIKKEKVQEEIKIKSDKKVVQGEKKIIKEEKKVVQEEKKVAKQGKKIVKDEKKIAKEDTKEKVEMKQDDYLSDVSSVHTSDLSDFDDEISLSSGDEEEAKKKKISLKVVKEITSGKTVSEDKSKKEKSTSEKTSTKRKEKDEKAESSDVKRKRKVNPKYTSEEYSSIYTKKRDGLDDDSENSLQSVGSLNEKTKTSKPSENVQSKKMSKKRAHQSFDKESDDSNQHNKPLKIGRKKSEEQIEKEFTRSSSRASVESKSSSISESTQDSNPSQPAKRKISKSR